MNAFAKMMTVAMPYFGILLAISGFFVFAFRQSNPNLENLYTAEEVEVLSAQKRLLGEAEARLAFSSKEFAKQFGDSWRKAEGIRADAYQRHSQSDHVMVTCAAGLMLLGAIILIGVISHRRDLRIERSHEQARRHAFGHSAGTDSYEAAAVDVAEA